jgi:hypothetical protein
MLRRALLLSAVVLWLAIPAAAQQKQHNVTVYFQQGACPAGQTCAATTSFDVYRATLNLGPWVSTALVGSVAVGSQIASCPTESGFLGACWAFVDTTGAGGTAYFYAVTAVDSGGFESAAKVTASAVTFPASPTPPTGIGAIAH